MRILYTCPLDLNMKGGGKTHFIELAQKIKIENDLLVLVPGYSPIPINKYGLNIKFIPLFKKNILSYLLYEILTFFYMIICQIKFNPDVIYCRPIYATVFPMLVAKIFNTKFVIEENGIREEELKLLNINPITILFAKIVDYLNCHFATKIISISKGTKHELIRRFGLEKSKIVVVPNGANIEHFIPLGKEECRNKLSLENTYFYVGYVGSFAPWQGIDSLIESAKLIKEKGYKDIRYLIVGGGGEQKRDLKQKVKKFGLEKEILFTGRVNYEEVVYYINAFDVAIAPFIKEKKPGLIGLSALKFSEYLACAKPVIASQIEGIKQVVEIAECGYLVEPGNANMLAKSIIQSYNDSEKLEELGKKGRKVAETQLNWKITAQKVLEVLEEIVAKK